MPVVGTLYPFEDVTLAPKVGGRVLRVFKDVGDRVGPGEPLMELDPVEYRLGWIRRDRRSRPNCASSS